MLAETTIKVGYYFIDSLDRICQTYLAFHRAVEMLMMPRYALTCIAASVARSYVRYIL